jgi:hypothetical protein
MLTQTGKLLSIFNDLSARFRDRLAIIWASAPIRVYAILTLAVNLGAWLAARRIDSEINEPQIALHYTVDFGIDYYDNLNKIYIIPSLGLILFLINLLLAALLLEHKDRYIILHILLAAALMANLVLVGGIAIIYLINIR